MFRHGLLLIIGTNASERDSVNITKPYSKKWRRLLEIGNNEETEERRHKQQKECGGGILLCIFVDRVSCT